MHQGTWICNDNTLEQALLSWRIPYSCNIKNHCFLCEREKYVFHPLLKQHSEIANIQRPCLLRISILLQLSAFWDIFLWDSSIWLYKQVAQICQTKSCDESGVDIEDFSEIPYLPEIVKLQEVFHLEQLATSYLCFLW